QLSEKKREPIRFEGSRLQSAAIDLPARFRAYLDAAAQFGAEQGGVQVTQRDSAGIELDFDLARKCKALERAHVDRLRHIGSNDREQRLARREWRNVDACLQGGAVHELG